MLAYETTQIYIFLVFQLRSEGLDVPYIGDVDEGVVEACEYAGDPEY
jgi:hypothetical protein